jgi:hypothetical protein
VVVALVDKMANLECTRLIAIAGIDGPNSHTASSGFESLPVRGTRGAVAPVSSELKLMLMIDDFGKRLGVRLIPDVPSGDARQCRKRNSRTRIRHSSQSKIDAIGKDGGEQQRAIRHSIAGTQVREVPPKIAPAIHLGEQVGDLDAGQKPRSPYAWRVSNSASSDSWLSSGVILRLGPYTPRRYAYGSSSAPFFDRERDDREAVIAGVVQVLLGSKPEATFENDEKAESRQLRPFMQIDRSIAAWLTRRPSGGMCGSGPRISNSEPAKRNASGLSSFQSGVPVLPMRSEQETAAAVSSLFLSVVPAFATEWYSQTPPKRN